MTSPPLGSAARGGRARSGITVRGARVHNLRGVDLDLPSDGFVVLVGPSGSGKSSLAFDTLHAEGQRRYLESLSARLRASLGSLPRPDVDVVHGLPPTIALAQTDAPTVGTLASLVEVDLALRVLFGRAGELRCPVSDVPVSSTPHDRIVAALLDLPVGTRLHVEAPAAPASDARHLLDGVAQLGFSRVRVDGVVRPLEEVRPEDVRAGVDVHVVVDRILVGPERRDRLHDAVRTAARVGRGVVLGVTDTTTLRFTDRPVSPVTGEVLPELRPALFRPSGATACATCRGRGVVDEVACAACHGTGLGPTARAVRYEGLRWTEVASATVAQVRGWAAVWSRTAVTTPVLAELASRLAALDDVGLGHLRLDAPLGSLASGELQRARLARQVGADLDRKSVV